MQKIIHEFHKLFQFILGCEYSFAYGEQQNDEKKNKSEAVKIWSIELLNLKRKKNRSNKKWIHPDSCLCTDDDDIRLEMTITDCKLIIIEYWATTKIELNWIEFWFSRGI